MGLVRSDLAVVDTVKKERRATIRLLIQLDIPSII